MASDTIIRVEALGKKYVIGHEAQRDRYVALRDVITRSARSAMRKVADMAKGRILVPGDEMEEFWALKDVSFEVKRGEVVGIIGRNGAGKSTLLKILSRITEPTEGRVTIKGRVASLLEVGTGFHPELTGRENVYLNGAILGMTRAEIKRKFDEIVAFAEVEKFLDTPVKRYSSGMYVRLAFAVAAHLEPEVLIVDEVLAVGDTEFQRKCLGKMNEVAGGGRTVLFVSHNMDALRRICLSGLVLASGRTLIRDQIDRSIEQYLSQMFKEGAGYQIEFPQRDEKKTHLRRIEILDMNGDPLNLPRTFDHVKFRIHFFSPSPIANGSVVFYIGLPSGTLLTLCSTAPDSAYPMRFEPGENVIDCDFPKLPLSAGHYVIGAGLAIPKVEWLDNQPQAGNFEVGGRDVFGSGMAPTAQRYPIPIPHSWSIQETQYISSVGAVPNAMNGDTKF
jgi:lipopolysaccharide transport system ATP-binding protein